MVFVSHAVPFRLSILLSFTKLGIQDNQFNLLHFLRSTLVNKLDQLRALSTGHFTIRWAVLEGVHLDAPGEMLCLRWAVLSILSVMMRWSMMMSMMMSMRVVTVSHHLLEPLLHDFLCRIKECFNVIPIISSINFYSRSARQVSMLELSTAWKLPLDSVLSLNNFKAVALTTCRSLYTPVLLK